MSDTVLVVDDDQGVLSLTSIVLRRAGFLVLQARDGPEAIAVAARAVDPLRLLILDVVLPSMGGNDVAQRILATHPDVRVLFISGYAREAMPAGRALDPAFDLLEKPFTPQMLMEKVRAALDS